jgi:hypothetical protein
MSLSSIRSRPCGYALTGSPRLMNGKHTTLFNASLATSKWARSLKG